MPLAWRSELESMLEAELRDGAIDNPFRPAVLRWAAATKRDADHAALLDHLERAPMGGRGTRRFRWQLPVGRWIAPEQLRGWRPAEAEAAERNPGEHAARLWLAPILVEHLAWLGELAARTDPADGGDAVLAARARAILDEAVPVVEDVVAASVAGGDVWADTFLLWSFARSPRALTPLRGLVLALASRYAARASRTGGVAHGRTFPYFNQSMASATAYLATAATTLGEGVDLVDRQLAFLAAERRADGGWGDLRQPSDLLTTLAAARLLGSLDPSFDPRSVVEPLHEIVGRAGGRPAAIGPEWPWLAVELVDYLGWADRDFIERFRWPNVAPAQVDPRVTLPRYEGYLGLGDLFGAVDALRQEPVEVTFIDLANFGHWNTAHGQDAGDVLLALLCRQLRTLPRSRAFRDGGDEFIVVGGPRATGLEQDLCSLFARWPSIARDAFPDLTDTSEVPVVVPLRAVISTERACDLRDTRRRQGVWVGALKHDYPSPPATGVIRRHTRAGDRESFVDAFPAGDDNRR
jgi:hypothetical protein